MSSGGMMTSQSAGPMLGSPDGTAGPGVGSGPAGAQDQMVPCPACQGAGTVPPDQAEEISEAMGSMAPDPDDQMASGEGTTSPESPVTGRTSPDIASVQDYAANRPSQLQHQPVDVGAAVATGKRVQQRMRQHGHLGR